jgi:hypothetical protein
MTESDAKLITQIQQEERALRAKAKKDLATLYCRTCLGPLSRAKDVCTDLNKAQMAYDICRARHGKRITALALL